MLIDIDVTADHVLKVTSALSGGAGISGLDAPQWHQLLLRQGGASERLRQAITNLT